MMDDDRLVREFESGTVDGACFGHREHLRVAWCYLRAMPLEDALARYVRGLRALAEKLGVAHKFHRTLTWTWILLVDEAMAASPGLGFDALLAAHPRLTDRDAPLALYERAQLDGEAARRRFVWPERPERPARP
jgi:hypothetical protein